MKIKALKTLVGNYGRLDEGWSPICPTGKPAHFWRLVTSRSLRRLVMADTKTRKRRVASYIGAGIVDPNPAPEPEPETPPEGGGDGTG